EASFESGDGIAPEIRSHAAPAVEVDLRHPPVAMPLSDFFSIVPDPTLVRDGERPVPLPPLRGLFPPTVDPAARLGDIAREPPYPPVPVERALDRSVVESPYPDRRSRLLVRLGRQPGLFELEEPSFKGETFLRPKTVDDAHAFLEPRIAPLHRNAEQPEVVG